MLMREGVDLSNLHPEMRHVKKHAGIIWKKNGQRCVILSGRDREHSDGSLHPFGQALDLETKVFGKEQAQVVADELQAALGPKFQVLFEGSHIHAEYDPK